MLLTVDAEGEVRAGVDDGESVEQRQNGGAQERVHLGADDSAAYDRGCAGEPVDRRRAVATLFSRAAMFSYSVLSFFVFRVSPVFRSRLVRFRVFFFVVISSFYGTSVETRVARTCIGLFVACHTAARGKTACSGSSGSRAGGRETARPFVIRRENRVRAERPSERGGIAKKCEKKITASGHAGGDARSALASAPRSLRDSRRTRSVPARRPQGCVLRANG